MITMPKELRQAILVSQGKPVRLADLDTNREYVVVQAEVYDQLQGLIYDDGPLTTNEKRNLLLKVGIRAGWTDSKMDVHDELDPRQPS